MIVTPENFHELITDLRNTKFIGFDTETYGVGHFDEMFSFIVAAEKRAYYLNFNDGPDHLGCMATTIIDKKWLWELSPYFSDYTKVWIAHNAAFDMQRIWLEKIPPPRRIHCTMTMERLIRNDRLDLSLDAIAPLYGYKKDDRVEKYIDEHKLYTMIQIPGKDKKEKQKHFDLVPFNLMAEYGEKDAVIARRIGIQQIAGHVPSIYE